MPVKQHDLLEAVVGQRLGNVQFVAEGSRLLDINEPAPIAEWQKAGDPRREITLDQLLRMNAGLDFHLDIVLPVKLNTTNSRDYLVQVLDRFRTELAQATGRSISDEQIKDAVQVHVGEQG